MYSFALDTDELARYVTWETEHDKTCPHALVENQGAIGGRMTYSFCPNSIGSIVTVKCACGEEVDLTDYHSW